MIDIEQLTLKYFQNSEEVPYKVKKGEPLLIKPILVKDYSIYENSIDIIKAAKEIITPEPVNYIKVKNSGWVE